MTGGNDGLTLAVTSSTGVMSLAIGRTDRPGAGVEQLAEVEIVTDRRHAEEISPRLEELLHKADVSLADLDRLVIDVGPGRFTGLRVGLATVRALGFALDLPVIGLTSLAVLAAGQRFGEADSGAGGDNHLDSDPGAVTAVIDARRSEVFQQTFVHGRPVGEPRVASPEALAGEARGVVVGDGVDRYHEQYAEQSALTGIVPIVGVAPRASVMIELSRGLAGRPGTEVEPLYLREPDAKPNIRTRVGSESAGARQKPGGPG